VYGSIWLDSEKSLQVTIWTQSAPPSMALIHALRNAALLPASQ
jgi:hypothetical protein